MKNVLLYMFLWLPFIPITQTVLQIDEFAENAYALQQAAYTSVAAIQNFLKTGCDKQVVQHAVDILKKSDDVFSKEQALSIAILLATQWTEDYQELENIASITIEKIFANSSRTDTAQLSQVLESTYQEMLEQRLRFERNF